ncbi:glucose-1-phosphate cytidylyltransferase (plasmid) [Paroceanicella profunda]|uniref:Glucose-1-phosphate cytidylyltransferase n=1 Tax=Paroceanicella profunda TaxID=2579971 RepID=A0A5B8FJS4_9RHOB|nr:glucose-1-phosphate cytidylyltransferase [Paroceanicella profunda]QDL94708.1 glucose-1-phosphate cytidylyltransferase [Paroceanicella profunda]
MKVVILAGGLGTRLSEETSILPKPLVEIGSEPIIWHIMKIFARFGAKEFIVCCGYKGFLIKKYFQDYHIRNSSVTFDLSRSTAQYIDEPRDDWRVTLVDTGLNTMTGGRLKRIRRFLDDDEPFLMTYGDGVGNIDIADLLSFHTAQGKMATVTAVQPTGRFGAMYLAGNDPTVQNFHEKPNGDGTWVNGGFFVLQPEVIDLIDGDATIWEHDPMRKLTEKGELVAYRHHGFWHPMDTLRDKTVLNDLWNAGDAPWRVW